MSDRDCFYPVGGEGRQVAAEYSGFLQSIQIYFAVGIFNCRFRDVLVEGEFVPNDEILDVIQRSVWRSAADADEQSVHP
jgi:hypothetical protein